MSLLKPFSARIFNKDQLPIGAGVLIAHNRVLTCAHVINAAANLPENNPTQPTGDILLDFPFVAQAGRLVATVILFHFDPTRQAEDIAVLQLKEKPIGCTEAVFCSEPDLSDYDFHAYGYPNKQDIGVWSAGKLGQANAAGLLQLTNELPTGYKVAPGFSGGPVWVSELNAAVGIVVSSDKNPQTRVSFLIPTQKLVSVYADLSGSVQSRRYTHLIADEDEIIGGVHQIRITEAAHGKLLWRGGITPKQFGILWNGPTDFEIAYDPTLGSFREVSDALLRSAIHGTGGKLFVAEPTKWKERSDDVVNRCLGANWDRSSPSLELATGNGWKLKQHTEYRDRDYAFSREYSSADLCIILHAMMDKMLLKKLADAAHDLLVDMKPGELGLEIEHDLSEEMWVVWQEWQNILHEHPEMLSHFFRILMSKADSKQRQFAQARVGIHTFTNCLLRSVIFALAIRVCLPWDFRPVMDARHANFKAKHGLAHLCGLQLIETVTIVQRVGSLVWDSDYVILPHFTDPGDDIPALSKSFVTSESRQGRLDKQATGTPLFLTGEGSFIRGLAGGNAVLKSHLISVVDKWKARQDGEIARVVEGAAHGS